MFKHKLNFFGKFENILEGKEKMNIVDLIKILMEKSYWSKV